jgi:hypothetical protein
MIDFRITINGTADLLMHNGRLSNPLDPATKALKKAMAPRTKTDEIYADIARIEHAGCLYHDPDVGPYIPSDNIWRCLLDAGKKHKFGVKVKEGILFPDSVNPLSYKGPRTVDGLWEDENFRHYATVRNQQSRVLRCRPLFREWATEATGVLDPNVLNFSELLTIANTAGSIIGLGDWRPRYGRFVATVEEL